MIKTPLLNRLSRSLLFALFPTLFTACGPRKQATPQAPPFPMVTAENLFAVFAPDQHHAWMVGFNSTIIHTPDAGATWDVQQSGVSAPLYDVSFVSAGTGWISGRVGTILHTMDGGKHWEQQKSGTNRHLFGISFVDERSGWAVGEFGTILHTGDGGKTWVSQGSGEDRIYNDVCFADRKNGWVAGEYGLIYHTTDGGTTWKLQVCREIIPVVDETEWETPTPSLYSIWFSDTFTGWASGMDSVIIATEDGGKNWKKIDNPLSDEKPTLYRVMARGNRVWAVGQRGSYLSSHDRGTHWEIPGNATNTKFWLRDMYFSDRRHGWAVGSRGTIIKTKDGGEHWKMLSGIPLSFTSQSGAEQ